MTASGHNIIASAAVISLVLSCVLTSSAAVAQVVTKIGTCPSGYHTSGGACVPSSRNGTVHPALPKSGTCPSGYHTSGDYCLASTDWAKHAIPKTGSCPSGYHTSGAYCLSNR